MTIYTYCSYKGSKSGYKYVNYNKKRVKHRIGYTVKRESGLKIKMAGSSCLAKKDRREVFWRCPR